MRVSSKGQYALVAMLDVAQNSGNRPVSLADVAARQRISLSYLEQLFSMLRRAGLVVASRGPGGGYRLQKDPGETRVAEVFRAVDDGGNGVDSGRDWSQGPAAALWEGLDGLVERFLEQMTLADVMAQDLARLPGRANGAQPPGLSA